MDYTKQIGSSISLNSEIGHGSTTSNNSTSQQAIQYPNNHSSMNSSSNNSQSNGNISMASTESSVIIDQNGESKILDIIENNPKASKIMNGRSYLQLTEKEQKEIYSIYANTILHFIIDYAKTKYSNISDVPFRDFIDHNGNITKGKHINKNIKDLKVKEIIQLSGINHIKKDDSFLNLEYRDFREVYMNKIKAYLSTI